MVKENVHINNLEINIMVISKMAKEKEKENVLINNLEINMMVIGKTVKEKEKENILLKMEIYMMVILITIK